MQSFFLYIRPVLSSSKALGLTARSLHECCGAQCSHARSRVPRGENMDLCLDSGAWTCSGYTEASQDQSVAYLVKNWMLSW